MEYSFLTDSFQIFKDFDSLRSYILESLLLYLGISSGSLFKLCWVDVYVGFKLGSQTGSQTGDPFAKALPSSLSFSLKFFNVFREICVVSTSFFE